MRLICHPLLLLICCGSAWAQTNTNSALPAVPTARPDAEQLGVLAPAVSTNAISNAHISSDSARIVFDTRTVIYRGNVRLDHPRLHLTCEQLAAAVPEEEARLDSVVAETNVVIVLIDDQGKTNRAYADKAVYTYGVTEDGTNEVVELSGTVRPKLIRAGYVMEGNPIVFDLIRNEISATDQRAYPLADESTNAVPTTLPGSLKERMQTEPSGETTETMGPPEVQPDVSDE